MIKLKVVLTLAASLAFVPNSFAVFSLGESNNKVQSNTQVLRLSEPVSSDAQSETFGVVLDQSLPKVSLEQLAQNAAAYVGKAFQVDTKVAKVCQKKGCFFIAQQGKDVMRVAFRDYSFFVPTDSAGKTVTLSGELIQKELTAEQVEHFKKDMQGDSAAMKTGIVYEILADSVTIPRA